MATERNVVDFKIHNLTEEQFQELKAQGKIDPNAVYCTPDTTKERLDALETKTTSLEENKQDIATAVNYDNITNCITEIPQDIKLELADGTLTLKAGSKLHRAAGNLDETITIASDISATIGGNGQWMIILSATNNLYSAKVEGTTSGPIANRPSSTTEVRALYFATDENKMYLTGNSGAAWYNSADYSLPICIVTTSNGAITNIDQVFNGFGYIGSTVFALPGVKGLIPDGRNADGTLKNSNMTIQNVIIKTIPSNTGWHYITINAEGTNGDVATNYYTGTELPSGATNYSRFYNTAENITYNIVSGNLTKQSQFVLNCYIDHSTSSPYKINSMEQATAFHAVDYSDFETLSDKVETNNDNAVHKTGDETIAGVKTFSSLPIITNVTGNRVAVFNTNKQLVSDSNVSTTEIAYLDGLTGNVQTQLNGKANTAASNFTAAGKGTIVNLTMPNYSDGVAFTLNKSTSYTAPKDGFVFIHTGRANDQGSNIKIDGTAVATTISNWSNIPYFFPVAKGTVVSTDYDTISTAIFYPLKGAI